MAPCSLARPELPVLLPSIWPVLSSLHVYKDHMPNSGLDETIGGEINCLHRQLSPLASSKEEAHIQAQLMATALQVLWFMITSEKSILIPCQEIEFLGVMVHSHPPALCLLQYKLQMLKSKAQQLLHKDALHQTTTARDLAHINFIGHPVLQQCQYHQIHYFTGPSRHPSTILRNKRGAKQLSTSNRLRQEGVGMV